MSAELSVYLLVKWLPHSRAKRSGNNPDSVFSPGALSHIYAFVFFHLWWECKTEAIFGVSVNFIAGTQFSIGFSLTFIQGFGI